MRKVVARSAVTEAMLARDGKVGLLGLRFGERE